MTLPKMGPERAEGCSQYHGRHCSTSSGPTPRHHHAFHSGAPSNFNCLESLRPARKFGLSPHMRKAYLRLLG